MIHSNFTEKFGLALDQLETANVFILRRAIGKEPITYDGIQGALEQLYLTGRYNPIAMLLSDTDHDALLVELNKRFEHSDPDRPKPIKVTSLRYLMNIITGTPMSVERHAHVQPGIIYFIEIPPQPVIDIMDDQMFTEHTIISPYGVGRVEWRPRGVLRLKS